MCTPQVSAACQRGAEAWGPHTLLLEARCISLPTPGNGDHACHPSNLPSGRWGGISLSSNGHFHGDDVGSPLTLGAPALAGEGQLSTRRIQTEPPAHVQRLHPVGCWVTGRFRHCSCHEPSVSAYDCCAFQAAAWAQVSRRRTPLPRCRPAGPWQGLSPSPCALPAAGTAWETPTSSSPSTCNHCVAARRLGPPRV